MAKEIITNKFYDGITNKHYEQQNFFRELYYEAEKQGLKALFSEADKETAKQLVVIKAGVSLNDYYSNRSEIEIQAEAENALLQIENNALKNEELRGVIIDRVETAFFQWLNEKYKRKIPTKKFTETSYSTSGDKFIDVCKVTDYSKYFTIDIYREFLRKYNLERKTEATEREAQIIENEIYVGLRTPQQAKTKAEQEKKKEKLTIPQTAIYCYVSNIQITNENAAELLKKHSKYNSTRNLIQERIINSNSLTSISENKTADTKKRNNLLAVKRYASGAKMTKAENAITRIITTFEGNYNNFYTARTPLASGFR